MSAVQSTIAAPRKSRHSSSRIVAWVTGGILAVLVLTVAALAILPASETDKAHDDGKQVGLAVNHLYYADSTAEADAAIAELNAAVADTRDHAGDAVADQVAVQQSSLSRAADDYTGALTADDEFDQELYQADLEGTVDDLKAQANDFRDQGSDVHEAFWQGVDEGLSGN
jgi:hypothetical protein